MNDVKFLLSFILIICLVSTIYVCSKDPHKPGMHWDYVIECENGIAYMVKDGTQIQILNSDGTPLSCGQKIY